MESTMKADEEKFRFLIDGFPRNQDNLQGWNRVMDGKADVKFVLFFDCSNEVIYHQKKKYLKKNMTGIKDRFRKDVPPWPQVVQEGLLIPQINKDPVRMWSTNQTHGFVLQERQHNMAYISFQVVERWCWSSDLNEILVNLYMALNDCYSNYWCREYPHLKSFML